LNKDSRTYHFVTTYKDNPFLEQTIIDEIESLQAKNKSLWQIYGLGLQSQVEGLIFTNFEIVDEFPYWAKKQGIGIDFGYSADPTAIVKCALHPEMNFQSYHYA
jgi:phage terminase large subunit